MPQQTIFSEEARNKILTGINALANAVKLTLGPEGRICFIKKQNYQIATKDGVSVAESIELKDKTEDVGAKALIESCKKTNLEGGDGTTVTAVLVQAMVNQGFSAVEAGVSPISLIKGVRKATQFVGEFLDKMAVQIKDYKSIKNVASIAANDVEMGTHIANLFHKLGKEGIIVVEESKNLGYEEEYVKGVQWDKGMVSPYMMTDPVRYRAEIENPLILLTDEGVEFGETIYAFLEKINAEGKQKLVVIASDLTGKALEALVINNQNIMANGQRGRFKTLAVRAPYASTSQLQALEDLAALTGATVISKSKGMALPKKTEDVDLTVLGACSKIISDAGRTVIIGGQGKKKIVDQRIAKIREELKTEERDWEKTKLKERLARLTGEVAILRFGAENESLSKEMKYRIEDSTNATRNALEEGIVPGGEVALLRTSQALKSLQTNDNEARGVELVRQALLQPIDELAKNAGNTGSQVIKRILGNENPNYGWDASKDEYCDMIKRGIIDPKKVVKAALLNASATTQLLLSTECCIIDIDEEKKK